MAQTDKKEFEKALVNADPGAAKAKEDMDANKRKVESTAPGGLLKEVADATVKGALVGTGVGAVAQLVAKEALGPVGIVLGAVVAGVDAAVNSKTDHKKEMSDWKAGATAQINKFNDSRVEKWNQSNQRSQQLVEANPGYRVFQEAYQLTLQ